jgi:hypothetical protein
MTDAKPPPIRESIVIERGVESVWRTLTDEASVPNWLGCWHDTKAPGALFFMQPDRAIGAGERLSSANHCDIALDAMAGSDVRPMR